MPSHSTQSKVHIFTVSYKVPYDPLRLCTLLNPSFTQLTVDTGPLVFPQISQLCCFLRVVVLIQSSSWRILPSATTHTGLQISIGRSYIIVGSCSNVLFSKDITGLPYVKLYLAAPLHPTPPSYFLGLFFSLAEITI